MARIQDKLSKLVASQLPEFVRSDYTTFKTFLEAYYQFLEQDQNAQELLQNSRSYNDIDTTVDSFIEYFLKQYADNIPRELLGDKKLLIKKINDIYTAKGSSTGYKLLFQLLYGKQVDVFFPSTLVLKASSGKWVQKTSIFVEVLYGDISDITERVCTLVSPTKQINIKILDKRQTLIVSNGQTLTTTSNVFELFYDNTSPPPVEPGDYITYQGFRARVLSIPNKVTIQQGGAGFKVGDIITVDVLEGRGIQLKVTETTSGAISGLSFLTYGVRYPSVFSFNYSLTDSAELNFFEFFSGSITLREKVGDISDSGTINLSTYTLDAFDAAYCGELLSSFSYSPAVTATTSSNSIAILQFSSTGAKTNYPGYYSTTDGFLSDEYSLQDRDYYQPFAYVLRIDEQLKNYKRVVNQIMHPAGTKLHGDYRITNNINVLTDVMTVIGFILNDFSDIFTMVDDGHTLSITKPLNETLTASEVYVASFDKQLANLLILSETTVLDISKPLANVISLEEVYTSDVTKPLVFSSDYAVEYFLETIDDLPYIEGSADTVLMEDSVEITLNP